MITLTLDVNPVPWKAGTAYRRGPRGAGIAKDAELTAYQEAVKEALRERVEAIRSCFMEPLPWSGPIVLDVWFTRRLDTYVSDSGRNVTKHRADLSNLVKAFEDACQGILFDNDNQVVMNSARIVDQSKEAEPLIQVRISRPHEGVSRA